MGESLLSMERERRSSVSIPVDALVSDHRLRERTRVRVVVGDRVRLSGGLCYLGLGVRTDIVRSRDRVGVAGVGRRRSVRGLVLRSRKRFVSGRSVRHLRLSHAMRFGDQVGLRAVLTRRRLAWASGREAGFEVGIVAGEDSARSARNGPVLVEVQGVVLVSTIRRSSNLRPRVLRAGQRSRPCGEKIRSASSRS